MNGILRISHSRRLSRYIIPAAFLIGSLLLFAIFKGIVDKNELLNRYEMEKGLGPIMSIIPFIEPESSSFTLEDVQTFDSMELLALGIYDSNGDPMLQLGSAPSEMEPLPTPSGMFMREQRGSVITYIRNLPGYNMFSDPRPPEGLGEMSDPPPPLPPDSPESRMLQEVYNQENPPAVLYVSGIPSTAAAGFQNWWLMYVAIELIFASLLIIVSRILRENQSYRDQLETQRHLVRLGEAARTLTHEIKNPLSAIRLRLNIIKRTAGSSEGPDMSPDIRVIEDEVERLNLLSSRIREFLVKPKGQPELVDMAGFLGELSERLPQDIRLVLDRNIEQGAECTVFADRERLRSAIENVIVNAGEASRGETIVVSLGLRRSSVEIQVRDSGPGIAADLRERIFEPFYTTKASGSGIGLSIVRQFVEAAGGSISVRDASDDEEKPGTVFTIKLPRGRNI